MQIIRLLFFILFFHITVKADDKISNLVIPVKYFVNHDSELEDLRAKLLLHNKAGIVGISGIGKTQFARMYAHTNQEHYKIIWFFDCDSDLSIQFVQLAKELNKKEQCNIAESVASAKQAVMNYMSPRKDWLLVFDNIKINGNKKLSDIMTWEHNGHLLISSQDGENLSNYIPIKYLKEQDATQLVVNILHNKDDEVVQKLISQFKGYPISLTQAAIFLDTNKHMSLEEYSAILTKSENKMKHHIELVIKELNASAINLLYKIAMINNQKFSKSLIKTMNNSDSFTEDLQSIIKFGLISLVSEDANRETFEMHDTVKKSLIEIANSKILQNVIEDNITHINGIMPKGKNDRQQLIAEDDTLLSNLEQLLINAEYYKIDIYKIMELRKNLMSFYVGLGSNRCQEMQEWLYQNKSKIESIFIGEHHRAVYAEYLVLIGIDECYLKASLANGIKAFREAEEIISNITGYFDLKFMTYSQLAQAYVFNGDQKNTKIYTYKSEELLNKIPNNLDVILLWVVKAKSDLADGKYTTALAFIQTALDLAKNLPQDYYVFPLYTIKSEILNYMHNFVDAYEITKRIYDLEIGHIKDGSAGGYRVRVIVELARAELGLTKIEESLGHSKEAIYIYINDKSRNNQNLALSKDTDLAAAFVIEGEALAAKGLQEIAAQSFATAETIFYNNYRENIIYLDNISYLYLQAAIATCNLPNSFWYTKFSTQLVEKFGKNHPRTIELFSKCKN